MKKMTLAACLIVSVFGLMACSDSDSNSQENSEQSGNDAKVDNGNSENETTPESGKDSDSGNNNDESGKDTGDDSATGNNEDKGNKILVAYYSAQNHTAAAAQVIIDTLEADAFVVTPVDVYTSEDLDWTNPDSRVCTEHDNPEGRHIALTTTDVPEWERYDVVFVGYPIWWQLAAWPIDDFIKDNDFSGKKVIPFCTSQSSGLGASGTTLAEMAGNGDWQEGKRFSQNFNKQDVVDWVNSLNLK